MRLTSLPPYSFSLSVSELSNPFFFLAPASPVKRDIVPREREKRGKANPGNLGHSIRIPPRRVTERERQTPAIFAVEEEEDGKREGKRERKGICFELIEFSAPIV